MILKVGTVIFLTKEDSDDESKYKSRIVDIQEDFVMIDYPAHVETGKTTFLTNDTELFITFTDELKMS